MLDGFGAGVARLALPWLLFSLTRSALVLAVVAAAQLGSWWMGPIFGVFVDRMDRRTVLLVATTGNAAAWIAITTAVSQVQTLTPPMFVGISVLALLQQSLFNIGYQSQAVVRTLLTPPAARVGINTAYYTTNNITTYVSPALGGFIIATSGAVSALWVTVAATALMVLPTLWLQRMPATNAGPVRAVTSDLRIGAAVLRREHIVLGLSVLGLVYNGLWTALNALSVAFYRSDAHLTAVQVGIVGVASGAVATAVGTLTPWLQRRVSGCGVLVGCLVLMAAGLSTLGLACNLATVIAGMTLRDLPGTAFLVLSSSIAQARIPAAVFARVQALRFLISMGTTGMWTLAAGALAGLVGLRLTFGAMAAVSLFALAVLPLTPLRSVAWPKPAGS